MSKAFLRFVRLSRRFASRGGASAAQRVRDAQRLDDNAKRVEAPNNTFLTGSLSAIYVKTALPIIFVMGMNGLLNLVDALILGWFVGPEALAAVTLMFPAWMIIVATATLVGGGMSSILARHLGAGRMDEAQAVFAGAHGLAWMLSLGLILLFVAFGDDVAILAAAGDAELAGMGLIYLQISVLASPLMFTLSVNSDALRNEGRVGFMAGLSLLVSIANIVFTYLLVAEAGLGVAGSAHGTVLAQLLSFTIVLGFRLKGRTSLRPAALTHHRLTGYWRDMLALGAPQSLNFLGISLATTAVIVALQWVDAPGYEDTVSAYGIVTRALTFCFMPMLGLSFAMQTITGNNFGAEAWARSDASLRIGLGAAFAYSVLIQLTLTVFATEVGTAFVSDAVVVAEVARILPVIVATFFLAGPLMILGTYFQAIGDAGRAALLGLTKNYVFAIPMTFALAAGVGEIGIWLAGPVSDLMMLALAGLVLWQAAASSPHRWGLFRAA